MVKPATILTTAALLLIALCVLAVTVSDVFSTESSSAASSSTSTPKRSELFADAGLTHNPAHGKPGHRHDLGDGALLTKAKTSLPAAPPVNIAAATLPGTANTTQGIDAASSVALNPAHGKPGHVCGIPVGSPLNDSTAAKKPAFTSRPA